MVVIVISFSNILGKENNLIVYIKRYVLFMYLEVLFIGFVVYMNIDRLFVLFYISIVGCYFLIFFLIFKI